MRLPSRFRPTLVPAVGFVLLASADPDRLREWYGEVLRAVDGEDGGQVVVVVDGRDDVAAANPEPGRAMLRLYVADAVAVMTRLDALGVTRAGATLVDPDGNHVQLVADDGSPAA
jgi:catechol 2,3-dioxygenase-like lactoylglutathione lyase family enzyme